MMNTALRIVLPVGRAVPANNRIEGGHGLRYDIPRDARPTTTLVRWDTGTGFLPRRNRGTVGIPANPHDV